MVGFSCIFISVVLLEVYVLILIYRIREKNEIMWQLKKNEIQKNIVNRAETDFSENINRKEKLISGAVTGFLSLNYFHSLLETEILQYSAKENEAENKKSDSAVIKFFCSEANLSAEEAALAGERIKKEFNGEIITACSNVKSLPNYFYYVYLPGIDKDKCLMFVFTASERAEAGVGKKFSFDVVNLSELNSLKLDKFLE